MSKTRRREAAGLSENEGHYSMAKQKIRPLEDRVVIQQIEAEEKTAGGKKRFTKKEKSSLNAQTR